MNDNLEYIDDYFQKVLNDVQRKEFETRCLSDDTFAKEVAQYVAMREALRQNLLEEKKQLWSTLVPSNIKSKEPGTGNEIEADRKIGTFRKAGLASETGQPGETIRRMEPSIPREGAIIRTLDIKKWLSLAAAACVITFLLLYPMLTSNSARDLVHEYVQNELTLTNTMDATRDSMQVAITAYQKKNYKQAIVIFRRLYASNVDDQQLLKYLGQAYLMEKDYENALKSFDALSQRQGLRSNPGVFLKAITLMERNSPGDEASAKSLFQQVVSEKLEGAAQAQEWLEKMN